jgi:hypothetical protein
MSVDFSYNYVSRWDVHLPCICPISEMMEQWIGRRVIHQLAIGNSLSHLSLKVNDQGADEFL